MIFNIGHFMILDNLNSVEYLRELNHDELGKLCGEIRELIIDTISKNGGHLSPSLGVVELSVILHYVFNTPHDKLIWDVGHQTYAHKIITGRKDKFPTIRKHGGISGFPKMNESEFDTYNVGHSSTSLSLGIGEAKGRDLQGKDYEVISVIGDGSITSGMAFEALNQIGHLESNMIIVLNDNEHSIDKNVGALSKYLNRIITGALYNKLRRKSIEFIKKIPKYGNSIYELTYRFFESFKGMIVPGQFFEDIGIRYFGPVDGHDIDSLIDLFENVKNIDQGGPRIVHVLTTKGKGYKHAETDPARFHGIGPFNKETGKSLNNNTKTYSELAGKTLVEIGDRDDKIIAITAAMKLGTGLHQFQDKFPHRFFDVGIAEQHAVTFAGALASTGLKPFVSIYSTFLQRAIDQLIHDIGIMNLPVKILIDRAGIVGDDGETHHGIFDIAMIKNIPNFLFMAPSNGSEFKTMIHFAAEYNDGPIAIRFPKGAAEVNGSEPDITELLNLRKAKILFQGENIAIFAIGDMVKISLEVRDVLKGRGISVSVVNLLFIKPLDIETIEKVISNTDNYITCENGSLSGGLGEFINSNISPELRSKNLFNVGFPDKFISHGNNSDLFKEYGIDAGSIAERLISKIDD